MSEDFVNRVIQTIERIRNTPPNVLDYVELRIAIGKLREESARENRPLTPEQDRELRRLAVDLLNHDNGRIVLDIAAIIANGGVSRPQFKMDTLLTVDFWHPRPDRPHPFEIVASILDDAGVFEDGEAPFYYDRGRLGIKTNSARKGAIFLTDRRLICVGFFSGFMGRAFRMCYDNWEEQPWVSSSDYLDYERIVDISPKRHELLVKYHTKYVETVEKSIGAGLYLFRFHPPDPSEVREDDIDIHIVLDDMKGYDAPPGFQVPADYQAKRQQEFLRRLTAAREARLR
ncbi:MAG: hypothetical protein ACTSPE_05045 [Candidatus Thorarchaeota archaeon]